MEARIVVIDNDDNMRELFAITVEAMKVGRSSVTTMPMIDLSSLQTTPS